ncbi:hypothetical protein [Pseudolysinimonas sp.]
MSPVAPRTVGLAVAVTASLAAAAGLVVGAVTRPPARRPRTRSGEFGIRNVPARPPLWDARPTTGPILTVPGFRDASVVGPENNHAPAER